MALGPAPPDSGPFAAFSEWFDEAWAYRQAADLAAGKHLWRQAYLQAGQAVELALKGRIMRQEQLTRWPDRNERRDVYTHDLGRLADVAGIRKTLEQAALAGSPLGLAWLVVKDFDINRRYPDSSAARFPARLGRDIVKAIGTDGLLQWLMSP